MSAWLFIIALTISSSIDNLGVGLSYGIRGMRISVYSNLLIAVICFLFSTGGIYFGLWISNILPGILPVVLGAVILVIIGIRIMLLANPRQNQQSEKISSNETHSKSFKNIMKNPAVIDFDNSNYLESVKPLSLGLPFQQMPLQTV